MGCGTNVVIWGLQLDLDLHAGGELQGHQGLHGLGGGLGDVDEPLVGPALELLPAVLVLVGGATPVRLAVSTIFSALWSITWWSYAFRRMRIFSFCAMFGFLLIRTVFD